MYLLSVGILKIIFHGNVNEDKNFNLLINAWTGRIFSESLVLNAVMKVFILVISAALLTPNLRCSEFWGKNNKYESIL